MGIGYESWQVEGIKRACVWAMDNIKVDLQKIWKRSHDFTQDRYKWPDFRKMLMKFRVF